MGRGRGGSWKERANGMRVNYQEQVSKIKIQAWFLDLDSSNVYKNKHVSFEVVRKITFSKKYILAIIK